MPNSLGSTGLVLATQAEWLAYFTAQYQTIYGSDINLESDSPDGQWMNIIIQVILDLQDFVSQCNTQFDPDQAIGAILDQRVAINGIQRQAGTYTITNVTFLLLQSVNLYGLDQTVQPVYTVADNVGNQWQLQTTQLGVGPGTLTFSFQAATPGANLTVPNTITVPVTIVLGVSTINNPSTYTTLGLNEETDAALKLRRQISVSLASQGYLQGLLAALENINGIISATVEENVTGSTNGDGVPGHSIWCILDGSASAASIAQAIYTKRNAGCGMYGATSYTLTQVDGSPFVVYWDFVSPQNLFITFTTTSLNGVAAPNVAAIRAGLVNSFVPTVNQEVNINNLATLVQEIDPNTLVTLSGFSSGQVQVMTLSGIAASGVFKVTYNGNSSANINWNDVIGTINTKVQAVSGLGTCVVTGSIASKTLTFTLTTVSSLLGLLYVTSNTLATSGPVAITFAYNEAYANTLSPSSKKNQFAVTAPNIIILPMILSPPTATVAGLGTLTMLGLGGYGSYVYTFQTNASGGSLNSSTGAYVAGSTPGSDVLLVTDALGNTATATISVT